MIKLSDPDKLLNIVDEIREIQKAYKKCASIYGDLQLAKQFAFDSAMEIQEVQDD